MTAGTIVGEPPDAEQARSNRGAGFPGTQTLDRTGLLGVSITVTRRNTPTTDLDGAIYVQPSR